jgi:hypothetical protein
LAEKAYADANNMVWDMKRVTARGFGLVVSMVVVACGQTQPDENVGQEAQRLVAPAQVSTFTLLASGHVKLGDRSMLSGGHIGVGPGAGDSVTEGFNARVAVGSATLGQRVVLKDRAVAGDLFATSVVPGTGATYTSLSPYSAPPALPSLAPFSAGSGSLTVSTPATLAAGNFGQVTVNSTLTLSGGAYRFQNLTFGTNAVLQASAPSVVRVAGKLSGANANFVRIGPTGAQPAANLRLLVAGANDTNGGVTLGTDARVTALVVSRASFTAADRFTGKGAIAASNVTLGNDASLTFQSGLECSSDAGCDDGQACTTDACVDAQCVHTAQPNGALCTSDDNECTTDVCSAGACTHAAVADGSSCPDDGDPCTADACTSGTCAHTADPLACAVEPPSPPRALPKPPSQVGCYWYTLNGWEAIPCEPVADVISGVGVPAIPPALSSPYVEETPNPTTSSNKVLVPPTGSTPLPFVFAQAEIMFPAIGGVQDAVPTPPDPFPGCASSGSPTPNALSVQLNTNKFLMDNGDNGAVQFAIQSTGLNDSAIHMCAWQVDVTTQSYDDTSVCIKAPPPTRDTPLQPFDFVNIAGSVDAAAGTMSIVVQLSWVEPGWPNIYAQTGPDKFGLANHWLQFDAAVLGMGGCTQAQFTDASVVTRMLGSTCPGVTTATSSTAGCPVTPLEPNAKFENRTATAETNNLIQLGTPSVSYLNPYLAVTNVTQTTSGSCVDPKHVYVRDYESDGGATPSNAAGQAFWESPDIFLVPKDSPVDVNSTPAQSLITPNTDFDVWVRVHNELGCAAVTGAKAQVYIADPAALSTPWSPLTNNQYLAGDASGRVEAGSKTLLGPFHYHAPADFGDAHKCLIASIIADGEDAVTNFFDAPNSNQVAQRNVQFENCAFPLTNAAGADGQAEIALTVAPPETAPSLSALPDITVTFDDDDSAWHDIWAAQPENGTAYAVSRDGNKTVVRLGKPSVTLHAVPLANGTSRTARGVLGLQAGASLATLGLQVALRDPSTGVLLAPLNGGSCKESGGPVIQ